MASTRIVSPGLSENSAVFAPYRTLQGVALVLRISADWSFPPFQRMSTSNPPRARRPVTEPSLQPAGRAGNKLISPAWL